MDEQITNYEEKTNEVNDVNIAEKVTAEETSFSDFDNRSMLKTIKSKITKKKIVICCVLVIVIAFSVFYTSKFKRVRNECLNIAGSIGGSGDYFTIDTYPDSYENMNSNVVALLSSDTREKALEAIKYANEELGFNGSLYSKMLETNSLMGRQSEENDKYKVSWTYHPDDGLEVTYEKK